jgi:hypothetical protein
MKYFYFLCVLLVSACSTTEIVSSWKAPDTSIDKETLNKVLVAVIAESDATRRASEDRMAEFHSSFIPSYTILPDPAVGKDELTCQSLFEEQGVEGVVVLRLLEVGKTQTFIPNNPGVPYWAGWHGRYWSSFDELGSYRDDLEYVVETSVFSLKRDELIWTGMSTTLNPGRFDRAMKEVVKVSYEKMKTDGLFNQD